MSQFTEVKYGNQIIKFPASMSTDEIAEAMQKNFPPAPVPSPRQRLQPVVTPTQPVVTPTQPVVTPTQPNVATSINPTAMMAATTGQTIPDSSSEELGYGDMAYWTNAARWKNSFVDLLPALGTLMAASNPATAGVSIGLNMIAAGTIGAQLRNTIKSTEAALQGTTTELPEDPLELGGYIFGQAVDSITDGAYETAIAISGSKVMNTVIGAAVPVVSSLVGTAKTNLTTGLQYNRSGIERFIKEASLDVDELALMQQLLAGVEKVKGTLMPSQIDPNNTVANTIESIAVNSIKGAQVMENNAVAVGKYLRGELTKLVDGSGKLGREAFGKALQATLKKARTASSLHFSDRYTELDKLGKGTTISFRRLKALTQGAVAKEQTLVSPTARQRGQTKLKFLTDNSLVALRDDIANMPATPTFSQAHGILKKINRKIDEVFDTTSPSKPIIRDLLSVKTEIMRAMKQGAAKSGNPELFATYQKLAADYHRTANIFYSETANTLKALNKPEQAGEYLAKVGNVTQPKQFKALLAEFKRQKVPGSEKDFAGSLESAFLAEHLRVPFRGFNQQFDAFDRINLMAEKLTHSQFDDTIRLVVPAEKIARMQAIIKEASILSRGASGQLSLAVSAGQIGAAKQIFNVNRTFTGRLTDVLTYMTPNKLADVITDPALANQMLGRIKAIHSQARRGDFAVDSVNPGTYKNLDELSKLLRFRIPTAAGRVVEAGSQEAERTKEQLRQEALAIQ